MPRTEKIVRFQRESELKEVPSEYKRETFNLFPGKCSYELTFSHKTYRAIALYQCRDKVEKRSFYMGRNERAGSYGRSVRFERKSIDRPARFSG